MTASLQTLLPATTSHQARPLDVSAWRAQLKAMGPVDKHQLRASLNSVTLPALMPAVRRDLHLALGRMSRHPDDVLELLYQDLSLAAAVVGRAEARPSHAPTSGLALAMQSLGAVDLAEVIDDHEMDAAPVRPLAEPWLHRSWCHAMAVSQLAGELSIAMGVDADMARLAGLLHDIGRPLLLTTRHADNLIRAYELAGRMTFPTRDAELSLLGLDHCQAGQAYGQRLGVPAAIREICEHHDLDGVMLDQLDGPSHRLASVVITADQLAKALGMGGLMDDELRPMPAAMATAVTELSVPLERCVAQIQTLCYWRTGSDGASPLPDDARLDGRLVVYISASAGPWHPMCCLLRRAGAQVIWFSSMKQVIDAKPMSDGMLLDFCDSSLHLSMPLLRRLAMMSCFEDIPKILLARRAEDPQRRMDQACLPMHVQATPIRTVSLLQAIRPLMP